MLTYPAFVLDAIFYLFVIFKRQLCSKYKDIVLYDYSLLGDGVGVADHRKWQETLSFYFVKTCGKRGA